MRCENVLARSRSRPSGCCLLRPPVSRSGPHVSWPPQENAPETRNPLRAKRRRRGRCQNQASHGSPDVENRHAGDDTSDASQGRGLADDVRPAAERNGCRSGWRAGRVPQRFAHDDFAESAQE